MMGGVCRRCGFLLEAGAWYCGHCGARSELRAVLSPAQGVTLDPGSSPGPWAYPSPWGLPPGSSSRQAVIAVGLAAALVITFSVAAFPFFRFPLVVPPSVPPGSIPLGVALSVSCSKAGCPPGGGSGCPNCAYNFTILNATYGVTPFDLAFQIVDASSTPLPGVIRSVSLLSSAGCTVGSWNSSSSSWVALNASSTCSSPTLYAPLTMGETLGLYPDSNSSGALSGKGYSLVILGTAGFTGEIFVTIS
jgi:hypothetical protein